MSVLQHILASMAPRQPPSMDEAYDGIQYQWKTFVFRPGMYQKEGYGLLFIAALLAMWYIGSSINAKKVAAW